MSSRIDSRLAHELELPEPDLSFDFDALGVEALLTSLDAAAHDEDATLAEYARYLDAHGASPAERRAGVELARDALDLLDDPDAAWQMLPVERWLHAAIARASFADAAGRVVQLARAFVTCLGAHGRVSLHGERLLLRRLGAPRCARIAAPPQVRPGRLAA